MVTDDEIVPVPGAVVYSITAASTLATTDQTGRFTLNGLQPGRLELQFQAMGYIGTTRAYQIVPGEVLEASVVLDRIPAKVGYSETWQHVGQFNASVGTPVLSPRLGEYAWSRPIPSDLRTTVSSVSWTSTVPATANRLQLRIDAWGARQADAAGPNPLIVRVDAYNISDPKKDRLWHDVVVPATCDAPNPSSCVAAAPVVLDVWVAQRFTMYVSAFFWEPAPEGFSNLP